MSETLSQVELPDLPKKGFINDLFGQLGANRTLLANIVFFTTVVIVVLAVVVLFITMIVLGLLVPSRFSLDSSKIIYWRYAGDTVVNQISIPTGDYSPIQLASNLQALFITNTNTTDRMLVDHHGAKGHFRFSTAAGKQFTFLNDANDANVIYDIIGINNNDLGQLYSVYRTENRPNRVFHD